MKNRHAASLIIITCIAVSFTLGFLAGRISAPGDTIITCAPEPTALPSRSEETLSAPDKLSVLPTLPAATAPETTVPEPAVPETTVPETGNSGLININTATLSQLDTLPGIGPVLAQRIIDYREAHGPFTAPAQLLLVNGIGEKRLADIIGLITTE